MIAKVAAMLLACASLALFPAVAEQRSSREPPPLIESVHGVDLYRAYCAVCHGMEGKGDGPMAQSLKARVPDLTQIRKRNRGKFPLERVRDIIAGDVELPAGHGTREMPVWGPVFSRVTWDQDLGPVRLQNLTKYTEELQSK